MLTVGYALALILPGLLALTGTVPVTGFLMYACGFIALASLMMLSFQFVTSGRFERLAAPFGLDVIMGFHRFAGRAVILAVTAHVLLGVLLAANGDLSEVPSVVIRLVASERLATGFLGLVLVLALVWFAMRRAELRLKYEWWRVSHGLGALALLVAASHHAWTNAVFLKSWSVAVASAAGVIVALASFSAIYGLRALKSKKAGWTVEAIRALGGGLHELTLKNVATSTFRFRAGQFAWVTFNRRHPVTDHPFSIASAPGELPKLRLIIKENGDFTGNIGSLAVGAPAYLDGPHGSFTANLRSPSFLLIAGGVGIAPILSIMHSLADDGYDGTIALLVATRGEQEQVFASEIQALARRLDMRWMFVVENATERWPGERGRIDEPKLEKLLSELPVHRAEVLMCGPLPMMDSTSKLLLGRGFSSDQIRYERFDYHEGADIKSRAMRWRFMLLLGITAGMVLMSALAGFYLSSAR